jgi:hypothetical protein
MSRRSPDEPTPAAHNLSHEFSVLTRRARFQAAKSSARSRSVPTSGRDGGRDNTQEILQGRLDGIFPYGDAVNESVTESQLDGFGEHTIDRALERDGPRSEDARSFKAANPNPTGDLDIIQNRQESDYTLSEERSRRHMDSDRVSETDTIVPRRNLSILDVAALIFNKMVRVPAYILYFVNG